jgi:hypothetical protein
MNTTFQLPRGIFATNETSGIAFTPAAGYTMAAVSDQKWTHVCRAVCSVQGLAPLIEALIEVCLPESFYAILSGHWYGDRIATYLSDFRPRAQIMEAFSPHLPLLVHDGMVGYGFACYNAERHEEIFLDDHKELTVLTSVPLVVAEVLARHGLPRNDQLAFLSEHGHAHENLGGQDAAYCHQIIQALGMERVDSSIPASVIP